MPEVEGAAISEATRRVGDALEESRVPLSHLELRQIEIPLKEHFKSAIGARSSRQALLIRWCDSAGNWGLAECSCRPDPFYSPEYVEAAVLTIATQIQPVLLPEMTAADLIGRLARIRGWEFTRGAVVDAAFDYLRRVGKPGPLEAWNPASQSRVLVGISLGLFEDSGALLARVGKELERGYRRIKFKIQPGMDPAPLLELRRWFPEALLGLDANGSFGHHNLEELLPLQGMRPVMLEQPFPPDRFDLLLELRRRAPGFRFCLDEGVHSIGDLRTAHLLKAIDELNLKPGRVGGELSALMLLQEARRLGIPAWIGGMFETGIGRIANLRLASRCNGAAIHDLSPSSRYFEEDLLSQPIRMNEVGEIPVPSAPADVDQETLEKFTRKIFKLKVGE